MPTADMNGFELPNQTVDFLVLMNPAFPLNFFHINKSTQFK